MDRTCSKLAFATLTGTNFVARNVPSPLPSRMASSEVVDAVCAIVTSMPISAFPSLLKSPKKSSPSGTAEDEIDTSCWGSNVPSPLARLTDNTVVKFGVSAMTKSGTPSLFRSTASVLVTSVKFCVISGWVWVEKLIGVWAEAIVDKPASSKTGPRTLEDRDTGGTPPELLILRVLSTWQRWVAWLSII